MKLADGISGHVDPATGRVKLMWRNREQAADGSVASRQRKVTADSLVAARELAVQVAASLRERGWWEPSDAPFRPAVEDLETVFLAYLHHKVEFERVRPNTRGNIARAFGRFAKGVRAVLGIRDEAAIPAERMTLPTYRLWVAWAGSRGMGGEGYGAGTVYQTANTVLDAWGWAADQGRWPSLPAPPYNRRAHLPPNPTYGPPTFVCWTADPTRALPPGLRAGGGGTTGGDRPGAVPPAARRARHRHGVRPEPPAPRPWGALPVPEQGLSVGAAP